VEPDNSFSSRDGIPLLAWPLRAKNLDGLRGMLENGSDPNARLVKQMNGEVVHFNNAMVYAAKMDDPRFLALLLKHGGDPNTRNSNNETLLYQAFISGNQWDNVKQLVESGANVNEPSLGPSDTPISWYSGRGAFEHVYWLLEHGADPSVVLKSSIGEPDRMFIAEHIYWASPLRISYLGKRSANSGSSSATFPGRPCQTESGRSVKHLDSRPGKR
ncbi:ankyrin repeat domain-containing protein, partial [Pseudomonas sp. K5]|uniref:ankyrin repeat domain-containing protein n=1 Tax=Pseudomonas sp. K5 TaxID=1156313 RepID=UPI00186648FD